jgi:hypothetical protein
MEFKKVSTIIINDDDKRYFDAYKYQIVLQIRYGSGQSLDFVFGKDDYSDAVSFFRNEVMERADFFTQVNNGSAKILLCGKDRLLMEINISC